MFPAYRTLRRNIRTGGSHIAIISKPFHRRSWKQHQLMTCPLPYQQPHLSYEKSTKRQKLSTSTNHLTPTVMEAKESQDGSKETVPKHLELTEVESVLRRLLLDVSRYIDESAPPPSSEGQVDLPADLAREKLVLRFTGGWVRDKLLGVGSHDIDVAINKMTGFQFGLRMKEYLELSGNPEKYGLEGVAKTESQSNKAETTGKSKVVGGLHKIEANPEKSKHLETVATRILGLDIDLVNLRKETYTEESRNPQMEFGTPQEDALRRDATVNAMFYNLNTNEIEDFTGQGHDDMRAKILRTPLDAFQTFKDDPLRVLRLIRFASRLGFAIESSVAASMNNKEIKDALRVKISRERVGVELEKMLRGPDPFTALTDIDRLELYRTIFVDPTQEENNGFTPENETWRSTLGLLKEVLEGKRTIKELLVRDAEELYLAWLLSCMVPYRDAPQAQGEPGKKIPPPLAANVAREGIKATNKVSDLITASYRNRQEISSLVRKQSEQRRRPHQLVQGDDPSARDTLGMAIRRWGPTWRSQMVFVLLADTADEPQSSSSILRDYDAFVSHLQKLEILDAYSLKPLLDGKALAKALSTRPGPWMKEALDVVMAWQLRNPDCRSPEEAIEEVKNQALHGELTTDLVNHFLRLTIRPLFAKTHHPAVTTQGRKVTTTVLPKKLDLEQSDEITKPWKGQDSHAIDLLDWVLKHLDERLVEQNWPLLVPPILSITDDTETSLKARGCAMITSLLAHTPPSLLAKTGLSQVFEEALMPCLGYLPSLTPESESISLLSNAYPALIALSKATYPIHPTPGTKLSLDETRARRAQSLDALIRKGILTAYAHCPERAQIVKVLLDNLCVINTELGIDSVKHIKNVLPMLVAVLGQPFGSAYPPTLLSGVKALQSVILNGWPRMAANRGEVLKGLTLCWLQTYDSTESGIEEIRKEAQVTVRMLKDAIGDDNGIEADVQSLVAADGRLKALLLVS